MAVYKSKKPTKDGRQYFFRVKYKDIFGVSHDYSSSKFLTKKEATSEEALYLVKINNQQVATSSVTLEQVFLDYYNQKKKQVKKQSLEKEMNLWKYLNPIKDHKVNSIDLAVYRKWRTYAEEIDFSTSMLRKVMQLFKRLINYSAKYYNTSDAILKFVDSVKSVNEQKKEMDCFSLEEYLKFDSFIDDYSYHTFFELLFFMGLRQGEAQALTWKDVDFKNKKISVTKTLTTKIKGEEWTISTPKTKNSIRILPIPKKVLESLKTLYNDALAFKDFDENWFVFGNVKPFPESTISVKKNKYCQLADLRQIRVHDFRHSCATFLINNGASISLVSKWLGHSNINITLSTYAHIYKNEMEEMAKKIDSLCV
jgi:integrase